MNSLKRMVPYVRRYYWTALLLVITVILPVGMELMVPRVLNYMIDEGIRAQDMTIIIQGASLMLVTALIGALATLGQGVFRAQLSQGLAYDMRNDLFAHIQTFSFANLDHLQTGQLMTRISSDVDLVRIFTSTGLALLLRALLMVGGSLFMMFLIDWQLALIMLVILPLAGLLIFSVMHIARPIFLIVQQALSALNTTVQENLAGVQVVKAFVREPYEIKRFQVRNDEYLHESIKVGRLMAAALPVLTVLTNVGLVAVVVFGGVSVTNEHLSVGELVAFISYLLISMAPLLLLGNILTMVSRAEASAERVWEVMDTQPVLEVTDDPYKPDKVNGEIAFTNVSFRYDGDRHSDEGRPDKRKYGGKKVLNGIDISVGRGQRAAFLGATGSGKSTLVNLVPRFYDPILGGIQIDGVNLREWEPEVLRRHIGIVFQQTTLFSGTIRENIAFGKPDAAMEEVINAAKAAQAHDFISALPDGYQSLVEERGVNFSGGQKQRIAIARALLISPRILILDDSTSAVDMETEALIQQSLADMRHQQTTIIVAQRISSVLSADQIFVLDHGRIAANGTHLQLLQSSSIYQEIFNSQMGNGQKNPDPAGHHG